MIIFILYFLVLNLYSVFSYALTDPNLVLISHETYWSFQQWMWSNVLVDPKFMAYSYVFMILVSFGVYLTLVDYLKNNHRTPNNLFKSKYIFFYLLLLVPLLLSYNALSHDVFNYIFNAKMVAVYGANPHTQTALEFPSDLWTRFMHNTHTSAPYGYGWTAISLAPFYSGMQKFILTLASFRILALTSLLFLYFSMQEFSKVMMKRKLELHELALVFLNPLLLIEVISNYHNDLWMMAPALLSLVFILKPVTHKTSDMNKKIWFTVISAILLGFSISIKLATAVLIPVWIWIFGMLFISNKSTTLIHKQFKLKIPAEIFENILYSFLEKIIYYVPGISAFLMFIPLFTSRSQQFLPWYLLWILVWVPFIKNKTYKNVILVFSLSSMLRYAPWLYNGLDYGDNVLFTQKLITWSIPIVYLFTNLKKNIKKLN